MSTDPRHQCHDEPLKKYVEDFGRSYSSAIARAGGASPSRARRRAWRLRAPVAIGVLAASGFIVAAVLPTGEAVDVVQAASAALGSGNEIVHYRIRRDVGFREGTGPAGPCSAGTVEEVWQTSMRPLRYRVLTPAPPKSCDGDFRTADGKPITGAQERSFAGATFTTYLPNLNRVAVVTGVSKQTPPVSLPGMPSEAVDPVAALRDALNTGKLRERRRANGRIELTGHTKESIGDGKRPSGLIIHHDLSYIVDASNFRPIRLSSTDTTYYFKGNGRRKDGSFTASTSVTFQDYESLKLDANSERLLSIHPAASAVTTTSAAK